MKLNNFLIERFFIGIGLVIKSQVQSATGQILEYVPSNQNMVVCCLGILKFKIEVRNKNSHTSLTTFS